MLRELRPKDTERLYAFLKVDFPEEEALLGTRPEGVSKVVRRIFRWDTRILLGLMRLFGRSLFRFFVIDENGGIVATTLLSFTARTGWVSMVAVDRGHRRQGLARRLLEQARATTARRGRKYIALDVLEANTPARTLYASLGYRPLRARAFFVHESPGAFLNAPATAAGVRPFQRADAAPLVEIARKATPPAVAEVLPFRANELTSPRWLDAILSTESAAWVLDRGHGPEAYVAASATSVTEAGHLSSPIVGESVDAEAARHLLQTALAWLARKGPTRVLALVAEDNVRGRAAVESVGFRSALPAITMYRESA